MVGVLSEQRVCLSGSRMTEVEVRVTSIERLALGEGTIKEEKKNSVRKEKIEKGPLKMIEWEAEED